MAIVPGIAPASHDTREPIKSPISGPFSPAFEAWWRLYPRKVGKLEAYRKFQRALTQGASIEALTAGVQAYRDAMRGTDLKYVAHPSTWLHQGRWMDERTTNPTTIQTLGSARRWQYEDCPHTPHCGSASRCEVTTILEQGRRERGLL